MKKKMRLIPLMVAVLMAFGAIGAFAEGFTDTKGHWAENYINDAVAKKILKGYNDGTFKPEQPVSKLESIIMISNLYPASTVTDIFKEKGPAWTQKLREAKIPSWADPYVVFALEKKMFTATNLKNFIRQDVPGEHQYPAYRWEFVVLLTNGLEMSSQLPASTDLKYKDLNKIETNVRPYIQLMVDKKVLNGTGNFDGKSTLTRAQAATIISLAYPLSPKATGGTPMPTPTAPATSTATPTATPTTTTPPAPTAEGTVMLGKLASLLVNDQDLFVNFVDDKGVASILTNNLAQVVLTKNNQKIQAKDIVDKNIHAQVTVDSADKRKVLRINIMEAATPQIVPATDPVVATQGKFISADAVTLTVEVGGKAQSYNYDSKTAVMINGNAAGIVNLHTGDLITVSAQGTYAKAVESKGVNKIAEGIVGQISGDKITLVIGNKEEGYLVQSGASVYKNGTKTTLDKVVVGDKVIAQIVNSVVVAVEATTNKLEASALLIKSVTFSAYGDSEIIAEDVKGSKYTFHISPNTVVYLDGKSGSLQDLKVGYEIDIKAENTVAMQIDAYKVTRLVSLNGIIRSVEYNNVNGRNAMVIALDSGGTSSVIVTDDTQIYNVSDSRLRTIDAMVTGDSVLVEGFNTDNGLEAKRIVYTAR